MLYIIQKANELCTNKIKILFKSKCIQKQTTETAASFSTHSQLNKRKFRENIFYQFTIISVIFLRNVTTLKEETILLG